MIKLPGWLLGGIISLLFPISYFLCIPNYPGEAGWACLIYSAASFSGIPSKVLLSESGPLIFHVVNFLIYFLIGALFGLIFTIINKKFTYKNSIISCLFLGLGLSIIILFFPFIGLAFLAYNSNGYLLTLLSLFIGIVIGFLYWKYFKN